jgi:uncharacterized membrane protein
MTWYIGICGITAIGLLYRLSDMVKCVYYMSFGFNGCFVTNTTLMGGYYKTNIISGVGHPMSDFVVSLVLGMVAYNIRGTGVVLQVSRDSANPVENEKYFG